MSNLDKVFFPDSGITKGDLVEYYRQIASIMLPYLQDRPLILHRYPDGIDQERLIQQQVSSYFPDWIERIQVKKRDNGYVDHPLCQNAATLIYLANQACISLHVWPSRTDRLDYPDQLVFDLDPSGESFALVKEVALILKKFLQELDLEPYVKTSGSRGLHVVIFLDRGADFLKVRGFAQETARILSELEPEKVTVEQRKEWRKGYVLMDYVRNSYGQSMIAPYSIRALPGAPISTPLDWNELSDVDLTAQSFTVKNIFERLSRKSDPWSGRWLRPYSLEIAQQKLDRLKLGSLKSR